MDDLTPEGPVFVSAAFAELLRAAEVFARLPVPEHAPDDGYQFLGDACQRVYFRDVRRLRAAIEDVRKLWRLENAVAARARA